MEDYICYDGKIHMSKEVAEMPREQREAEFQRLFGKYVDVDEVENDNDRYGKGS